jgi:glyoxylase-like metal-dependent hydrolase (beta-lactamase superfamily II)
MSTSERPIHHLGCGTLCPHGGRLISGEGSLFGTARLICHCLLVERADGLVLIDTGFGLDDMRNRSQLGRIYNIAFALQASEAATAVEQVRALGFQPQDVREIVATHLDLDHTGGLPDFPDANVHVLSRELQAALHPSLRERERYIAVHWAHGPKWVEHGAEGDDWFGFQSVRILPGADPDIVLVPLFGHTRGHTGVAVKQGGRALKFYASQRLDIRRIETLKDGTEAVGNRVRVKVVKNKVAAPFRQAEFDIEYGKGISTSGCLIDLGLEHNIVSKSGSFFSYKDERLGQGRGNAKAYLDEHQEMAKEIEDKIYAALGLGKDLVTPITHSGTPSGAHSEGNRQAGERDKDAAPSVAPIEERPPGKPAVAAVAAA